MAAFNMEDFNEILEKCKDKSKQAEQDKVSEKQQINQFLCCFFKNVLLYFINLLIVFLSESHEMCL